MGRTAKLAVIAWAVVIIMIITTASAKARPTIWDEPTNPYVHIVDFFTPVAPPSPTREIGKTKPQRQSRGPSSTSITGKASWYASWCDCNAMTDQRWRGKTVTVSGPKGSMNVKINDAGPVARLHRVADLNPTAFQAVCGSLSKGICTVTITGP